MSAPVPPSQRSEADLRPSRIALRGGAVAVAASRRRGTTMGSRVSTSRTREAVYPMFLELAKACSTVDTFWQGFFDTMAMGRFPKGVVLRDDCLVHHSRKKTKTFELSQEVRSDWQNVAEFFRNECDIRSKRDWELRRASGEVDIQLTTAQINKRMKKDHANAIPEFTLTLRNRYELSPAEMSEVDVLLRYYSTSNLFRPGDVVYMSSGAIREIKTLVFDEITRRFTITAEAKAPRYAMKETYQDPVAYLTGAPFTKSIERKTGFHSDIRKQLEQMYAVQVAARKKLEEAVISPIPVPAITAKKGRGSAAAAAKKQQLEVVSIANEEAAIITDDDEIESTHHHHRSDDDSS